MFKVVTDVYGYMYI